MVKDIELDDTSNKNDDEIRSKRKTTLAGELTFL